MKMNAKFFREITLLTLPVLLIAAVAWWKTIKPVEPVVTLVVMTPPVAPGPLRVEVTGFANLELSPLDVWRGYNWGTLIQTQEKGKSVLPTAWKEVECGVSFIVRFAYRRGNVWKAVPEPKLKREQETFWIFSGGKGPDFPMRVNLSGVPGDADEVHMKGHLKIDRTYSGALPLRWIPPPNLKVTGARRTLTLLTNSFDLVIKKQGQPMPTPSASQQPKLQLMDAKWFILHRKPQVRQQFALHLRHSENGNWAAKQSCLLQNIHFFDADNREVLGYNELKGGLTEALMSFACVNQGSFSPEKLPSDSIAVLDIEDFAPRKPLRDQKQPIRLELDASDGNCWPTHIKVMLREEEGTAENLKKFGAPIPR